MEPVTLAMITSAATVLASEVGKGTASEAGKSAWGRVKSLFNWSAEPAEADLTDAIKRALEANEVLACQVVEILNAQPKDSASSLVGKISVDKGKVTVANTITGNITNNLTFN